ncbi:response regulator transcription factor [Anaeromicropila herbilytica]|uniref:Stage 0 sporulation protein A homolog n=1 Tax=Anaeromicropila herbilytica TaxID=2785025 RepID=A0A7R7IBL9_9FIRM|nr:response regulator transcription factor [Anaeromicropila herbilytica]BCN28911.1 DNA-binding response regulator [Anaeromicropila herbilytica]
MEKILIIEDNKDVNQMLKETLVNDGYEVHSSYDGMSGLKELKLNQYDMLLLDIMLPYLSGDQILRELRTFSDIPVIILSAKDMVSTKIDLLKLGADDYITKPFDLGEVSARVSTHLRRSHLHKITNPILIYKDLVLDMNLKTVIVNGILLDLTAKEYQIMELLMSNQDKLFSKINIYESIWNEEYLGDDNAVKTHMSNLRTKLKKANGENEYIETVWGLGYRLCKK